MLGTVRCSAFERDISTSWYAQSWIYRQYSTIRAVRFLCLPEAPYSVFCLRFLDCSSPSSFCIVYLPHFKTHFYFCLIILHILGEQCNILIHAWWFLIVTSEWWMPLLPQTSFIITLVLGTFKVLSDSSFEIFSSLLWAVLILLWYRIGAFLALQLFSQIQLFIENICLLPCLPIPHVQPCVVGWV